MSNKKHKYHYSGLEIHVLKGQTFDKPFKALFSTNYFSIVLVQHGIIRLQVNEEVKTLSSKVLIVIPIKNFYKVLDMDAKGLIYILSFPLGFAFKNSIEKPHTRFFEFLVMGSFKEVLIKHKEMVLLSRLIGHLRLNLLKSDKAIFKEETIWLNFNTFLFEMIGVCYKHFSHFKINNTRKEQLEIRFFETLSAHFNKQHTVTFYAKDLSVTAGHLSKTLKKVTGKTTKEHINEFIIAEAMLLLQNNYVTIRSICERLHFDRPSSFCRFFKTHTAISPLAYRRKMTNI